MLTECLKTRTLAKKPYWPNCARCLLEHNRATLLSNLVSLQWFIEIKLVTASDGHIMYFQYTHCVSANICSSNFVISENKSPQPMTTLELCSCTLIVSGVNTLTIFHAMLSLGIVHSERRVALIVARWVLISCEISSNVTDMFLNRLKSYIQLPFTISETCYLHFIVGVESAFWLSLN